MTFRYSERSPSSQVRRTYKCDACVLEWTEYVDRDAALPDCPKCEALAYRKIGLPGVLTNKSRAVDFAQATAESMGLTDINDHQRAGDVAYKAPAPLHTGAREALMREMAEAGAPVLSPDQQVLADSFFSGATTAAPGSAEHAMQLMGQQARANAAVAAKEGVDPVALLHKDRSPMKLDVVARAKMEAPAG